MEYTWELKFKKHSELSSKLINILNKNIYWKGNSNKKKVLHE